MRTADLDTDAAICAAMAADLDAYLLRDVLYWGLSDSGPRRKPYPQLTLGGLLMRLHHLEILQQHLSPDSYETFAQARDGAEEAFRNWRVHLERKLLTEASARTRAWSQFLIDCADSPGGCAGEYPTQAEVRTMIDLLVERAGGVQGIGQLQGQINGLDRRLKGLIASGEFVWDEILRAAYPSDRFWWLYASVVT